MVGINIQMYIYLPCSVASYGERERERKEEKKENKTQVVTFMYVL